MFLFQEELTSLDLAAAPEFNLLMKASSSAVIRWNEAGFWNKLRYFLPDRPFGVREGEARRLHASATAPNQAQPQMSSSSPAR